MGKPLEFWFQRLPVGVFQEPEYPRASGRYRYMPYRGPGHLRMGQALMKGPARCYYKAGWWRRKFTVKSVPEYGVLEVELG
jgi:hypothetical protein